MGLHYDGYYEERQKFLTADLKDCLDLIDAHYGRDQIEDEDDLEEVRAEALRQMDEAWTDKGSQEYERVQFWTKVYQASVRQ